jgi:hypothetical protein
MPVEKQYSPDNMLKNSAVKAIPGRDSELPEFRRGPPQNSMTLDEHAELDDTDMTSHHHHHHHHHHRKVS